MSGLRAELHREPWLRAYRVYLGSESHMPTMATHVGEDGRIVYEQVDDRLALRKPFLTLDESEVTALAKALLAASNPEDATLDALKDAREVRDRLLTLVERGPSS